MNGNEDSLDQWTARLREELSGRRVIVLGHLVTARALARDALKLGARGVMLVGYGSAPDGWEGPVARVPRPESGLLALPRAVAELGSRQRAVIEEFDAAGEAVVIGPSFEPPTMWGRVYVGHTRPLWESIENKTTVDDLWDAAGVDRAPSLVVHAASGALRAAARELDEGAGTVWSGDNATGRADGAELVFWIRDESQAALAAACLESRCRRARVMPYLEGVPCSIHAFVGPRAAAVFRPVENVTFRRPDGRFLWAGTDTWWDPRPEGREEMRSLARRVARHLTETIGYRGPFGIDGVMTEGGFVPTELNARWGYGMEPQAAVSPLPLRLVAAFVSSALEGPMEGLEDLVVKAADANRWGGPTLHAQAAARLGTATLKLGAEREQATVGKLSVTGTTENATVMVRPDRERSVGRSLLALGAAGFAAADAQFGSDIGTLSFDES